MNAEWRWDFTFEILPKMLWATLNTIMAAGIGYAIAMIVGLIFLIGQRTPFKIINMINRGVNHFIEVGPGKVLSGLIKRIDKNVKINTINNESDIKDLKI